MGNIKEVEISAPIEKYLTDLGYKVRSEVKGCDITAIKDDTLLVVECKKVLSLKLIYQAVDRQEFCDNVYIAIALTDGSKFRNRKHLLKLLRRLELGLIVVTFLKTKTRIDIVLEPKEYKKRRKHKRRASILDEMTNRSGNYNKGGSVKTKIMTAYKENSLQIASVLLNNGPLSSKDLKKMGTCEKTYSILYKNFYGWFQKESKRGQYSITPSGREALATYSDILTN